MSRFRDGRAEDTFARGAVVVLAGMLAMGAVVNSVAGDNKNLLTRVIGVVLSAAVGAAYLGVHVGLLRRWQPARVSLLTILTVAGSVVLFVLFDSWWTLGMGIAAIGLGFRGPLAVGAALLIATGCHAVLLARGAEGEGLLGIPVVNWVTAIVLYAMTRLVVVLQELRTTREHLARLQVDEERVRISRDLHDIIGRTLVAVSLRTETAMRLIDVDVARCRQQLEQLQASVCDGQTQLRALTSGPVITGLASELETAQRLFERLGIRAWIEAPPVEDRDVDKTLGAVVRESVTNMLKHSRPRECRITVRRESLATILSVVNDGARDTASGLGSTAEDHVSSADGTTDGTADETADGSGADGSGTDGSGTGLRAIRTRVEAMGGTLTAGRVDRQYRVIARIPHQQPEADPTTPAAAAAGVTS